MAEVAAGTHATGDADEQVRRQDRLQRPEARRATVGDVSECGALCVADRCNLAWKWLP
jgi:hypothetical protein